MGIRIDITGVESGINYYGQKLYGYVDKETTEKLTSLKYLIETGKYMNLAFDLADPLCHNCDTQITAEEFKKFCELYADDLEKYYPYGDYKKEWFLENEDIKKLLETEEDKILCWL